MDRAGKEEPIAGPQNFYSLPRISPDGTRVALAVGTVPNTNIWIRDLVRKTLTLLTFDETTDYCPLWTPDGKRIAFFSAREGKPGVYWKAADGTGEVEPLCSVTDRLVFPSSWSRDGNAMVLDEIAGGAALSMFAQLSRDLASSFKPSAITSTDIGVLSMKGERVRKPLLKEKHGERNSQISPDGRWMAYASNESGRVGVYVRPFPDVDSGKWQVSTSGGGEPRWSRDGRELFYRSGDAMMAVAVQTEPAFKAGVPETLFRGNYYSLIGHMWDLSPDGKRFLMIKPESVGEASAAGAPQKINIVLNWFEELNQRVPRKN